MTLQQFHYVIVVAENGSMNKAAEALFISQPTLTNAIKALEQEAGITIFNRTNKGVDLTSEGAEFLMRAKQIYKQYERLLEKYAGNGNAKRIFSVSTQHYSFAVRAFAETVKRFDASRYQFSILETQTGQVIRDVSSMRSEIGIIYLSDFNRKVIEKLLVENDLEFHRLISSNAYAYLWRGHPLAKKEAIRFEELLEYPILSYEQGEDFSLYMSEEILGEQEYPYMIKVGDRATMLCLMKELNGYTLCSGAVREALGGNDYVIVPLQPDKHLPDSMMEIGYILKGQLSEVGKAYIEELKKDELKRQEYLKNGKY